MDNHSPEIDGATVATGAVYEPDGGATAESSAEGTILFSDADLADVHSATITGVSATGIVSGLPSEASLLALLTTHPLVEPAATNPGALAWQFAATGQAFDYLAAGEVVTLTYSITIADDQGGEALQDVVITVTGQNDAPAVDPGSTAVGAVHEPDGNPADGSASGILSFTDADLSDTHDVAVIGIGAAGATAGLPDQAALLALLTTDALVEPANGGAGTIAWHFVAPDGAFDYLADGEIVTLTYSVAISDGHGGETPQDIVITVTGRNDVPLIDGTSTIAGALVAPHGDPGAGAVSGALLFTDADLADTHSVTVTGVGATGATSGLPDQTALLGLLTTDPLAEPAAGSKGSAAWHFTAPDGTFDYLVAGETVTLTYSVLVADGQGSQAAQDITILVTGRNHEPLIDAGSTTTGAVHEPDGVAADGSVSGTILFTDAEPSDTHLISVAGVAATGATAGLPDQAALLVLLTTDPVAEPAAGMPGSAAWHFSAPEGAFDYLGDGETVTLIYSVVLADNEGGETLQDITINVTGRNDAPAIADASSTTGAADEPNGDAAAGSAAGVLLFSDADLSDTHSLTVTGVSTAGVTGGLPDQAALLALLTADPLAEPADGATGSVGWHFAATDAAFDYLAEGETVTLTYQVAVADGHGGEALQDIVVTVTGRDDAPAIDGASIIAGAAFEPDGNAADGSASGTLLFTDPDLSDAHVAAVTSVAATGATGGLPDAAALLALLTADPPVEPANGAAGSVGWHFAAPDGAFDYLGDGETVTLTYEVAIGNGHGGDTLQDVTVVVTGRNDPISIDDASTLSGCVDEPNGGPPAASAATGALLFADADRSDLHQVSVTGVSMAGATAGLPDAAALASLLTTEVTEPTGGKEGSVAWHFALSGGAFDYLRDGETVTLTYALAIADGHGGQATRDVTIIVSGGDDAPAIDAASTTHASVHEWSGSSFSGGGGAGTILFTDAEAADTHHVAIAGVTAAGVTGGLPDNAALLALLGTDAVVEPGGAAGSVGWHFDATPGLFDYLKTGETATLSYDVEISDDEGGITHQSIVIDAGQVHANYQYSYSFADGAAPWTSWMTNAVVHDEDDPVYTDYTRFTLPGTIDPNHVDGIGPLWLLSHLGSAAIGSAGAMDLRGAEVDITIKGENFDPNGAALYIWICSYLPNGAQTDYYYSGIQITNWAFTGQNLATSVGSDWSTIKVKLDANPADWTYAGNNISGQGDWANRYAPMDLNAALGNVNATLHIVLVGTDPNHKPSGTLDIENVTVQTAKPAVSILHASQIVTGLENHDVSGAVNGADPTGQSGLQFTVVPDSEQHGTVALDAHTGAFLFTPDHDFYGLTDTETPAYFDFVVSDGVSQSSPHRVYVNIAPVAPVPETFAGAEDMEIAAGQPFSFYLLKGGDVNHSELTFAVDPASVHGGQLSLDAATGRYTFVPDPGFDGAAGFAYTVSNGVEQSAPKTVTLIVDPAGQVQPGLSYQTVFQNYQATGDAFAFTRDLKLLADHGDANAAYQLGISLLSGGRGVTSDWAGAAHYFSLSVGTVPDGSVQLARLYLTGEGVDRDYAKANALLHGVESVPQAQYLLGITSSLGFGTPVDLEAAVAHFLHAASQGNMDAMYTLGRRYLAGDGVAADPTAAYFWLETALKYENGGLVAPFTQLLSYDAALAAAQLGADDVAAIQRAVNLWHPGLPTPYETQGDYDIAHNVSGSFLGVAYLSYTDTYEFSGVLLKRAYSDGQGHEVASQTFTFDGGYVIAKNGSPTESYTIFEDGGYERRYYVDATFLGQSYHSYANHYGPDGFRDKQTFYAADGHEVGAELFSPDGGYLLSIAGAPREQKSMDGDGGYAVHYFIGGTFLGKSYASYTNHYGADGSRDQTFLASDGSALASQTFSSDGGYMLSIAGAPKEQRVMDGDGGYAIRYFTSGAFLGQSYQSYANHYAPNGFRNEQIFYASDGHVVIDQSFTADGGYSLSLAGVPREQRIIEDDGSYSVHYFLGGSFLGQSYASYTNHYEPSGSREQTFFGSDGKPVASLSFTVDGGYQLSIGGIAKEERVMDGTGGYFFHYFLGGSYLGQSYQSYANHYASNGFRDEQLSYAADGHVVIDQSFTPDGGYLLSLAGVPREQRIIQGDGSYAIHYFLGGSYLGQAYASYTNHYEPDGSREQTFFAADDSAVASLSFTPDGGYQLSIGGVPKEERLMDGDGGYFFHYFLGGSFAGQAYASYANHYGANSFRDEQLFYDADGHVVVDQSFTPDGGYLLTVGGAPREERVMDGDGGYAVHYYVAGSFLGEAYQSYANHYDAHGFGDLKSFYAADGHVAALQSFSPDGGYSIELEGVVTNARTMIANGAYDLYYHVSGQAYSSEDDIYLASGQRVEQGLRYDNGDLRMTLSGAGSDVDIGDTVSFHFSDGSYDLGAAGSVYLNLGGAENEVTLFGDQHDVTLDGFAPSAGSILHLPESLFADFADMRAHATQQGNNVVLDTGGHMVTFLKLHLEDLSQANFSFG